ncbi:MAG: PQQ-binding-like beta-propeller repeat protein [Rubripirellula sp.]
MDGSSIYSHLEQLILGNVMMRVAIARNLICLLVVLSSSCIAAENWERFRGPDGQGKAASNVVMTWDADTNVAWKLDLPGLGSSSPVLHSGKVFVTCYSGESGEKAERILVCADAQTGKQLWTHSVPAPAQEDSYRGFITEHGYASGSAACDGKNVYAFFGKAGVIALTMDGELLWHVQVGSMSSNRRWGSGASVVLSDNILIVNAAEEARALIGLNIADGSEAWKADYDNLELCFATPVLVEGEAGVIEAVIAMPGETWGLNPKTGKLRWFYETGTGGNVSPSVVVGEEAFYTFGGYPQQQTVAIRRGGRKNITESHRLWETGESSYVATPLLHDGHLYWVSDRGFAFAMNAKTGETVTKARLAGLRSGGRPVYASPILVGDKLVVVTRKSGTLVFAASPEMKVLHQNPPLDESQFNGTPAVVDGSLYLRSDQAIYCIR